jgi:hypothetical protein
LRAKGYDPKAIVLSAKIESKLEKSKSMAVDTKPKDKAQLGKYDGQKIVNKKIEKGKLHFVSSKANSMKVNADYLNQKEGEEY